MSGTFLTSILLSFATFLSRILGLVRDVLLARILGGGVLMSAWSLAWQAPNLFRRILGEGALGNALVPILTDTVEKKGADVARSKFSTITIWLFFLLALITAVVSSTALVAEHFAETERWKLAWLTIPVIMPYCILICFVGIFTSVLNTFHLFFLPAIMNLLPNIFFIGTAYFFLPGLIDTPVRALHTISVAMLISGVLEVLILSVILKWKNMLPSVTRKAFFDFSAIREVWEKVLPGLIGASALQVGVLADGWIAMSVNDYAKAAMYYSDRLVYLPIGLFGVAFGTVSLPLLSKFAASGKMKSVLISTFTSIRQQMFITIPMMVFMILFARELLALLFSGGKFGEMELNQAYKAMFWYAWGIPFFCLTKLTVNAFYCRKNMKTPAMISIFCIILNIILSLILKGPMAQGGIALATVITSILNNAVLLWILRKDFGRMPLNGTCKFSGIILFLSGMAGVAAWYTFDWLQQHPEYHFLPCGIFQLGCAGVVFSTVFIVLAALFRIHELKNAVKLITSKLRRRRQ